MQRGHWNEASGSELLGDALRARSRPEENSATGLGRTGSGVCSAGLLLGCLLVALDIVAFSTWVRVGLMPQARHGASGVWALAVVGSKLEGTGFEKLQMVQTHVAVLDGGASTGKTRSGPSGCRDGEEVLFREGPPAGPGERGCTEARLDGLGIRVILAEDLRKPPWEESLSMHLGTSDRGAAHRTQSARRP